MDYIDQDRGRLELVECLGARRIEGPPRRQGIYPVTVDASGWPAGQEGLACALRSTVPGGTCTSVTIYYAPTERPLPEMYDVGITFRTGRVNARAVLPSVLDLVASGRVQPDRISTIVDWEAAIDAFRDPPTKLVSQRPNA